MARSRKGIKFNHRGSSDQNGSRPSLAELSDAVSDPGSPLRQSMDGKADAIKEEVGTAVQRLIHGHLGDHLFRVVVRL